ncbi:MAG: aspartyl/glutamyl-tRNA amidotransferase subunit A [Spirochaetales bacterium]|jgi:aspartyl-tRNA(Asn)/glutamyl-tRNA(Gln) amidotransferase subunit A|nr:aspartyl/glutamyl-tRNA amidotransferase subunit A [Spirochaetales bacterium]
MEPKEKPVPFERGIFNKDFVNHAVQGNARCGAFLELSPEKGAALWGEYQNDGPRPLEGQVFGVKDNIAVKNFRLTCGSKILENFTAPYTASVVERLLRAGGAILGKTNLDEFGMGSSTDSSALGRTHNPWDPSRVAGGSSGGSAAAVAAGLAAFALGSDTGGSIRQPANFCGVYGLKPTYGTLSRYGLVAYASSLEVIGILSGDPELLALVFKTARGADPLDNTSQAHPEDEEPGASPAALQPGDVIAVLKGELGLEPPVALAYDRAQEALREAGFKLTEARLPSLEYVVPAYYTIATAEASANLARYTGIKYGLRVRDPRDAEDLVIRSRSEGFGGEVKLRILLGTYVLRSGFQDRFYIRAQKIRTAIRKDFDGLFKDARALLMPVFPSQAFPHGEEGLDSFQQKVADRFTCTANLAGIPALSVPTGLEGGLPVGVQFLSPAYGEGILFSAARSLRTILPPAALPGAQGRWLC